MAITIYPPFEKDFSSNGLGILTPISCTVEEDARGKYELILEHPIHDDLRWAMLQPGCIIKAPAPRRESPIYEYDEDIIDGVDRTIIRRIYKANTQRMYLRLEPKVNTVKLCTLPHRTEVILLDYDGKKWAHVMKLKDGQTGYCPIGGLTFVREQEEIISEAKIIGTRTVQLNQSRDQLFRIYSVEQDTGKRMITARALHVFYDDAGNPVMDAYSPDKADPAQVISTMQEKMMEPGRIHIRCLHLNSTFSGDLQHKSPVEILLDPENGMVAQTGALLIRDNYEAWLLPGSDRDTGVTIRRGKNLQGVTVQRDASAIATRIIPVGRNANGDPLYLEGAGYVDSPRIADEPLPRCVRMEFDVQAGSDAFPNDHAARAELMRLANAQFSESGADLPAYGMEVDFILLGNTSEYAAYAALQTVHLHDTVTIIDELIGLKAKLRVSAYTWNCLTEQYERLNLGDVISAQQTIYAYDLPNASLPGSKIIPGSLSGAALRSASIQYAKIAVAAIDQLSADSIAALTARLQEIIASSLTTDELYAALADINRISIQQADIDWAHIDRLNAVLATMVQASMGTADIDWAHIKDLASDTAIITEGVGGKLMISRLAVTEANMVSLTTGELVVKGADGRFYTVSVDENGDIQTQLKLMGNDDISDLSINAGEKIIEGSVTAACLNASEIFADSALIRELIAANLDVDRLFAREAFINLLRTTKIVGDKSITLIAEDASNAAIASQTALSTAIHDGETPPEDAPDGKLWLDRSVVPCVLRRKADNDLPVDDMEAWETVNDATIIHAAQVELRNRQLNLEAQQKHMATFIRLDKDMVRIGKESVTSEFQIDAWGAGVAINGIIFSRFESDRVRFGNMEMRKPAVGGLAFDSITDVAGSEHTNGN